MLNATRACVNMKRKDHFTYFFLLIPTCDKNMRYKRND